MQTPLNQLLMQCLQDHHYLVRLLISKHFKQAIVDKLSKDVFQAEWVDAAIDLFKDSDVLVSLEMFQGIIEIMQTKFTPE
eukprot:NODE_118_length_2475_cov_55.854081_g106_i0.p1 GENE.NODE_118_length_2475_cov_55.854081_g106_i0~~NODE_118_length_2475_cov_55.854081_g106_i0.p1  ORF type:complete len:80 (-),score=24.52 NODE_118_length_2475_cov_55.854081_g106_i0:1627-1866(-)